MPIMDNAGGSNTPSAPNRGRQLLLSKGSVWGSVSELVRGNSRQNILSSGCSNAMRQALSAYPGGRTASRNPAYSRRARRDPLPGKGVGVTPVVGRDTQGSGMGLARPPGHLGANLTAAKPKGEIRLFLPSGGEGGLLTAPKTFFSGCFKGLTPKPMVTLYTPALYFLPAKEALCAI